MCLFCLKKRKICVIIKRKPTKIRFIYTFFGIWELTPSSSIPQCIPELFKCTASSSSLSFSHLKNRLSIEPVPNDPIHENFTLQTYRFIYWWWYVFLTVAHRNTIGFVTILQINISIWFSIPRSRFVYLVHFDSTFSFFSPDERAIVRLQQSKSWFVKINRPLPLWLSFTFS